MITKNEINNFLENPNKSYKIIKIDVKNNIKNFLQKINITDFNYYDYHGETNLLNIKDLIDFLNCIGNNNKKSIESLAKFLKKLLFKISKEYIKQNNKKIYCWFTIRVSKPNEDYDIQRWHTDAKYYISDNFQSKFLLTLKGASTLVKDCNDKKIDKLNKILEDSKKIINPIYEKEEYMRTRLLRNKLVKNDKIKKVKTLVNGIISLSNKTVHSEPRVKKDRIFLSILTMTKEEYELLLQRKFF